NVLKVMDLISEHLPILSNNNSWHKGSKDIVEDINIKQEMDKITKLPDLPESLLEDIRSFVSSLLKFPPPNEELSYEQIQSFYEIVYSEMEDPIELNEKMNSIEKYVTTVLYEKIFCPKWSDDSLKDEELNSKILALNYLNLKDLGIELNSNQQQIVELVVKLSSSELENLNQRKSPFEKLECLINCHKIINAHLILPLLIHIIIKSNPKKLISNLRFIQRFRVRNLIDNEMSYCLTNILAVIGFLETADYLDLNNNNIINSSSGRRVGHEIVKVADSGVKVITDAFDSSYKLFGRILGSNDIFFDKDNINNKNNVNKLPSTKSTITPGIDEAKQENEMQQPQQHRKRKSSSSSMVDRLLSFNVLPHFSGDGNIIKKEIKNSIYKDDIKISPPIQKFLDCSIDDFHVKDVPELLEDYKRLAKSMHKLNLFSK
ncbi:5938_t:CDS:2, partial [Entrophospora sp. SA101]